jgi:hypothetical protein
LPRVNWTTVPVRVSATSTCVTKASCSQSVNVSVKATQRPSGEIVGLLTAPMSTSSSMVGTRGAVAAV